MNNIFQIIKVINHYNISILDYLQIKNICNIPFMQYNNKNNRLYIWYMNYTWYYYLSSLFLAKQTKWV